MIGHASIPWITGGCSGRMIRPRDGYVGDGFLADVDTKANAEFIVRAANAHDALVAACNEARAFVGIVLDLYGDELPLVGGTECYCKLRDAIILANTPAEVKP